MDGKVGWTWWTSLPKRNGSSWHF